MLTIDHAVGRLRPGTVGNSPDDVRRVQYLFNRTSVADGAPAEILDTTAGSVTGELIDAITAFQSFHSLVVDGRVDPGEATLAKFNEVADLSAFEQVREPDEFLSWLRRPREWNFTLEDRLGLAGGSLRLRPEAAAWLPVSYADNLIRMFDTVLDPQQRPAAAWGVGAFDLYHAHVVVPMNPVTGQPLVPETERPARAVKGIDALVDPLRNAFQPGTATSVAAIAAYAAALAPIWLQMREPLSQLATTGVAALYYHSFESSRLLGETSRYAGFTGADPRRNWFAPLDSGAPTPYVSADHPDNPTLDFFMPLQLHFLVDKSGAIGVVGGTKEELVTITGQPFATVA